MFDLGTGDGTVAESTKIAIDNTETFYETDLIPGPSNDIEEALNAGIARVEQDRGARRNTPRSGSPVLSGRIRVPVLTLHNLGDLFVPFSMEIDYAQDVADQGRSRLYRTATASRYSAMRARWPSTSVGPALWVATAMWVAPIASHFEA